MANWIQQNQVTEMHLVTVPLQASLHTAVEDHKLITKKKATHFSRLKEMFFLYYQLEIKNHALKQYVTLNCHKMELLLFNHGRERAQT